MKPLALFIGVSLALLIVQQSSLANTNPVRGIRNNNPGNIRDSSHNNWVGQVGQEAGFVIFDQPFNGIRAIGRLYDSYLNAGFLTIQQFINRYAPSFDQNNVPAYVRHVERDTQINRNQTLTSNNKFQMVKAIIHHEIGSEPYPDAMIQSALRS